jgi:hypothetical protein
MSSIEMSQEEFDKFTQEKAAVTGQTIALQFMRKHLAEYSPCTANSQILGEYVKEHNLPWTVESLEEALEACKSRLVKATPPADEKEVSIEVDPLASTPLPPGWNMEIPFSSRADVRHMDAEVYKFWFHSKKYGEAFRARVNLIQQLRPGEDR